MSALLLQPLHSTGLIHRCTHLNVVVRFRRILTKQNILEIHVVKRHHRWLGYFSTLVVLYSCLHASFWLGDFIMENARRSLL